MKNYLFIIKMADPATITIIVLSSLSLAASLISPLIIATSEFIKRIKKSDCCGGHIELASQQHINVPKPEEKVELPKQDDLFNRFKDLFKK